MLTLDHYRPCLAEQRVLARASQHHAARPGRRDARPWCSAASSPMSPCARSWRGRRLIDALAWLPWMMPGMVLGVGFLWAFAMLPGPIPIYGTIWALLLAYMALGTPIAVRVMSAAYRAALLRPRGMLARARRELVADAVAHPDRAGVAVLRGRLGADLLRHHARTVAPRSCSIRSARRCCRSCCCKLWTNGKAETGQRDRPDA